MVKIGEEAKKTKLSKSQLNENRGGIYKFCGNRGEYASLP